jgi:tRNA G18 (ribose-2'-O)-methylase SpoU
MGHAEQGGLERAARQLGVTSMILPQHGWKAASPACVKAAAVDARWAPEVRRARQEARQLASELAGGQVRAWTGREQDASYQAAGYRAGRLLRRSPEG